jgi:hypothetical protein
MARRKVIRVVQRKIWPNDREATKSSWSNKSAMIMVITKMARRLTTPIEAIVKIETKVTILTSI